MMRKPMHFPVVPLGQTLDARSMPLLALCGGSSNWKPVHPRRPTRCQTTWCDQIRSGSVNAHLTLARVQAACALVDDAQETFEEALTAFNSGGLEAEWGAILQTVGQEIGVGPVTMSEPDRTASWYWYGP